MTGFATALNEITLVLFTTLAPSGAVAYVIMGMAALRAQGDERKRLSGALLIPFLVTLVGLVASATHLGNPDNALYVFSRVGASPLSNEVCAAVLFLGISGLHWLYQFAEHARQRVLNVLLGAAMVASLAFLISVAFAYASRTVVTWDTPFVPVALCLNALVGGPVLTFLLAVLAVVAVRKPGGRDAARPLVRSSPSECGRVRRPRHERTYDEKLPCVRRTACTDVWRDGDGFLPACCSRGCSGRSSAHARARHLGCIGRHRVCAGVRRHLRDAFRVLHDAYDLRHQFIALLAWYPAGDRPG